jgi:hypothetical protein
LSLLPASAKLPSKAEHIALKIAAVFREAGRRVAAETKPTELRDAIENKADVNRVIAWSVGERYLQRFLPELELEALRLGAGRAAVQMRQRGIIEKKIDYGRKKPPRSVTIRFDVTDPRSVDYIRQHSGDLIKEWGSSSKQAVRVILDKGFNNGRTPYQMARQIRESGIGLLDRQATAMENYRRRLENDTAADLTDTQIQGRVDRYASKLLRERSEMIARTETNSALSEGRAQQWAQAMEAGLLDPGQKKEWVAGMNEATCEICQGLDGEQRLLTEPYSTGVMRPPQHPRCTCSDVLVFEPD